jgi:hypothetical protein
MVGPSDHSDGPPLVLKSENFFNCLLITELSRTVATETSNDKHPHSQSVCVCVCVLQLLLKLTGLLYLVMGLVQG